MTQDMLTLDFNRIIERLQAHAVSPLARKKLAETAPIMNEGLCKARMEETTAALHVMKNAGSPPLAEMEEVEKSLSEAAQGGMLLPEQLSGVARFCVTVRRMRRYLQSAEMFSAGIASWQVELPDVHALEEEIDGSVREDTVLDDASPTLRSLRRQRERAEQEMREKIYALHRENPRFLWEPEAYLDETELSVLRKMLKEKEEDRINHSEPSYQVQKLRMLRKTLKKNQRDFAKMIHYPVGKYPDFENGKRDVTLLWRHGITYTAEDFEWFMNLVRATSVNPEWLLSEDEYSMYSVDETATLDEEKTYSESSWMTPMFATEAVISKWEREIRSIWQESWDK